MIGDIELAGQRLLDFFLHNRDEISRDTEDSVLASLAELAYEEEIRGCRSIAISLEWSSAYRAFEIGEHRFLRRNEWTRHEEFAVVVTREGKLAEGKTGLADLRMEINAAIDNKIADLRDEADESRLRVTHGTR